MKIAILYTGGADNIKLVKKYLPITLRLLVVIVAFFGTIGIFWSTTKLHRNIKISEVFKFDSKIINIKRSKNKIEFWIEDNLEPFYVIDNSIQVSDNSQLTFEIGQNVKGLAVEDEWITPSNKGFTIVEMLIGNRNIFTIKDFNNGQKDTGTFAYIFGSIFGLFSRGIY